MEKTKELGFTHFFCARVATWGKQQILDVIRAQ